MGYKEKAADIIEDYKASINALKSKYNKDLEGLEDYKEDEKAIEKFINKFDNVLLDGKEL